MTDAPDPISIRSARAEDLPALGPLELQAAARFADSLHPYAQELPPFDTGELGELQRAGTVWVAVTAEDRPVGFAIAGWLGDEPYLHELDVAPAYARRGIGRALIARVAAWASTSGHASLLLSTFADVPWNGPYYARLGFETIPLAVYTQVFLAQRAREAAAGLRVESRVIMRAPLARLLQ
jgi:GNAT superfamily N-acetyltransferase